MLFYIKIKVNIKQGREKFNIKRISGHSTNVTRIENLKSGREEEREREGKNAINIFKINNKTM